MVEYPYHRRLRLKNFTAFQDTEIDFVPGVNVFIGENGTGKTHVMKAMYAIQLTLSRDLPNIWESLEQLFQVTALSRIVRMGVAKTVRAEVSGIYGDHEWSYSIGRDNLTTYSGNLNMAKPERPVFIPAIDMMGHTKGFVEAYAEIRLDFDLACRDIVNLLRLERRNGKVSNVIPDNLTRLLGGEIERDDEGRFYLVTSNGRLPMPLVAEGLRKIATLIQVQRNGWLMPGATLFWDEPEVNLNPVIMDEVVGAILNLARNGVQIFLATHSYIMLRELEVQSGGEDSLCFFSLSRDADGVAVHPANTYLEIAPNPIERQYADLYDRGIAKRMKGP